MCPHHVRKNLLHVAQACPGLRPARPDLCLAVTGVALALEGIEAHLFGRAWLEALVLAIVLGTAVRTAWSPGPRFVRGIAFGAKTVLEIAVVLLGASLSVGTLLEGGPGLLIGIAGVVALRHFRKLRHRPGPRAGPAPRHPRRLRATRSVGTRRSRRRPPVIGADGQDVASSIAFTAVLGVLVVLGLPLLVPLLGLSPMQYGVLAGLTGLCRTAGVGCYGSGGGSQRPGRNPGQSWSAC